MKPDQCRLQACLLETVPTLCKNGLIYHKRIKIQGLLGITVDDGDVILIQYNDILECSAGLNAFNEEFHETISDKQHELSRFSKSNSTNQAKRKRVKESSTQQITSHSATSDISAQADWTDISCKKVERFGGKCENVDETKSSNFDRGTGNETSKSSASVRYDTITIKSEDDSDDDNKDNIPVYNERRLPELENEFQNQFHSAAVDEEKIGYFSNSEFDNSKMDDNEWISSDQSVKPYSFSNYNQQKFQKSTAKRKLSHVSRTGQIFTQ